MEETAENIVTPCQIKESEKSEMIKIFGVGGAGGNAVNNMFRLGIKGVNYVICNTDTQALDDSPISRKIQLGKNRTAGLGAGNNPEVGRDSAVESEEEIRAILEDNTRMVFVTAGMGGGTGTGAAPVIARMAKDMDILTVGIVSIPFKSEGRPRLRQAIKGVETMAKCVDSLLIINSQRLNDMYGDLPLSTSFAKGDEVLAVAAKGLAEIISKHMTVNVDFADVKTALTDSGCSLMGTGESTGENRAVEAVKKAMESPLLNNNNIRGATHILFNVTSNPNKEMTQNELCAIMNYLYDQAGGEENEQNRIIWGAGVSEEIEDDTLRVTVIATGFATDCFEDNHPKKEVYVIPLKPESAEEKQKKEVDKRSSLELDSTDQIIHQLYNEVAESQKESYDTRNLRDATSEPFNTLNDDKLNQIENTPAFIRRGGSC